MESLSAYIESLDIDIYGYADLRHFAKELRESLPFGISIGIAVNSDIIKNIPDGPFLDYVEAYSSITNRLDEISQLVANFITELGYRSIALDRKYISKQIELTKNKCENKHGKALMPHKTIAANANLGWITKSALIVTEKYGSAVRFTSVLTDAPLNTTPVSYECKCGKCTVCKDNCPTGAINGITWTREISLEQLINYDLCQKAHEERGNLIGVDTGGTCGICIAVCPFTAKYINGK